MNNLRSFISRSDSSSDVLIYTEISFVFVFVSGFIIFVDVNLRARHEWGCVVLPLAKSMGIHSQAVLARNDLRRFELFDIDGEKVGLRRF